MKRDHVMLMLLTVALVLHVVAHACGCCGSIDPKCVVAPQACAIAQRDVDAGPPHGD